MQSTRIHEAMRLLLCAIALLLLCGAAGAQSFSHILSFQGRLCGTDGKPLPDGPYAVKFTMYDAQTEGSSLWTETQGVTQVGGAFVAYLGSVTGLPANLFSGGDRWLGITVGGDPEMPERYRLTPAPWAIQAASADTVDGFHASQTPTPNYILPLDASGRIPASVIAPPLPPDDDWAFSGSNIYRMDGNVGIGTSSPNYRLWVETPSQIAGMCVATYAVYGEGSAAGGAFYDRDNGAYGKVGVGYDGVYAEGDNCGGHFLDGNSSASCYCAYDTYKVRGYGTASFAQNHPEDPDRLIVYCCPEGDEVATYTRGTARLVDGVARVSLGETFRWVTNPDIGLTAHLTARGKCEGLYVESLTTTEMVVREQRDGVSDVVFDYIVYGLRIGFEEVSIVQDKVDEEAYIPSMASHRERYAKYPDLRRYNALERFKRMRAANGETQAVDLTAAHSLRDAIIEFDPAIHTIHRPDPERVRR
jgi:hypothetical protein